MPDGGWIEAALFGALAQSALLVGALLVWKFPGLQRPVIVGGLMAFGAGAVISAVSVDLVSVSYDEAGALPTAIGIGIGCLIYFGIIAFLERRGEAEQPGVAIEAEIEEEMAVAGAVAAQPPVESHGATAKEARNLTIGMVIDGVPESIAIGLTLHTASVGVSAALVGSVFIAAIPEAIGVAAALLAGGMMLGRVLLRFSLIVVVGAVFAAAGYSLLYGVPDSLQAIIQSIAAGALLVVVINEMIPIAVRSVKAWAGLIGAAGFVFAAILTWAAGG
ncbi:MAG: ZIP family metal transporter [Candidatus Nanopelagicales bacterium]|jgi:ZIP family zinc transporter